ncbi:MAG: penicillin-binding protein activator [Candidatus Zixiibacteriota bacterium]
MRVETRHNSERRRARSGQASAAGLFGAILLVFSVCGPARGQLTSRDRQEISGIEQRAFVSLAREDFALAAALFSELRARYPASEKNDGWLFNVARCLYHQDMLADADRRLRELFDRFAGSPLVPFANRLLGDIAFRRADTREAVSQYLQAYSNSREQRLSQLVERELKALLLSDPQAGTVVVSEITAMTMSGEKRDRLLAALDRELKPSLDSGSRERLEAHRRLAGSTDSRSSGSWKISLALPLSGKLQRYGAQIERGALLASRVARTERGVGLDLVTSDTHGNPANAAQVALEAHNSEALAMIGPLTSEEAVAVSATLNCAEIAALAPAASQTDFTQISQATFQMTPSPEMIGRRLAEYAFMALPASTAAALAPNSDKERRMAEAFVDRFQTLGGEIVAFEIFPPSATDFGGFCRKIKKRFLAGYEQNAVMLSADGDTLDLDEAPIDIGCIFIPATQSQLKLALPQINFHNIFTTLIGSEGLSSKNIREMTLQNVRQVIFNSALTQDNDNQKYVEFAQRYRDVYGETPSRLSALGYDAVALIVDGLLSGARSQTSMRKFLGGVREFSGASGEVSFGADHTNQAIALYTLIEGLPQRLDWKGPALVREGR